MSDAIDSSFDLGNLVNWLVIECLAPSVGCSMQSLVTAPSVTSSIEVVQILRRCWLIELYVNSETDCDE